MINEEDRLLNEAKDNICDAMTNLMELVKCYLDEYSDEYKLKITKVLSLMVEAKGILG